MFSRRFKIFLAIIFFTALASGYFWPHQFYFQSLRGGGDEVLYDHIATDLIEKGTFTTQGRPVYIEPLYPFFLAGVYTVFGHHLDAVRFIQLGIFALTAVLIAILGWRLFSERVGIAAGAFSAVYWGFANMTGVLLRETLSIFLMVVLAHALISATVTRKTRYFLMAGAVLGFYILLNAIIQYFILPALILYFCVLRGLPFKQIVLRMAVFVCAVIFVLAPWMVRNHIYYQHDGAFIVPRTGQMIALRASLMETLWPNMPKYFFGHAFGYYFAEKIYPDFDTRAFRDFSLFNSRVKQLQNQGYDYAEIDAKLLDVSIQYIKEHPQQYAAMFLLDIISFTSPIIPQRIFGGNSFMHFTFAEGRFSQVPTWIKTTMLITVRFIWYMLLGLVLFAFVQFRNRMKDVWWLLSLCMVVTIAYCSVHGIPRYALPLHPFYFILAIASAFSIWDTIGHRCTKTVRMTPKLT